MLLSFPGSCGLPVQQGKASASALMSCPEFLFNLNFSYRHFYIQNLHAVIYLIFCIFLLYYLFTVHIVFLLHAVIFSECCFALVCRNKSPTVLMIHVVNIQQKNKISMSMSHYCTFYLLQSVLWEYEPLPIGA